MRLLQIPDPYSFIQFIHELSQEREHFAITIDRETRCLVDVIYIHGTEIIESGVKTTALLVVIEISSLPPNIILNLRLPYICVRAHVRSINSSGIVVVTWHSRFTNAIWFSYIGNSWAAKFYIQSLHDDVIEWKHLPRYWPFVRAIHRSPVNSPHKGQWRGTLMFSLICAWITGEVNNREAGDLRRYHAHYDVIVMGTYGHVLCYVPFVSVQFRHMQMKKLISVPINHENDGTRNGVNPS